MRRVFGKKKEQGPAPSLDETSSKMGGRIDQINQKIDGLEKELRVYKDKIKNPRAQQQKKVSRSVLWMY